MLFVISSLAGGGAERVVSILLNNFDRDLFEPQLALFIKGGEYLDSIPGDVRIFDLQKRTRYDFFKVILKLGRLINQEKPDCVISFLTYTNIVTGIVSVLFPLETKFVFSERSDPLQGLRHARCGWLKRMLVRAIYLKADKIITISEGIKKSLVSYFGLNESKIQTIYNPINVEEVVSLSEENVSHPFFNNKIARPVIIAIGRLTRPKNYPLLLQAFAEVSKQKPVSLIILGQGALRDELISLGKSLGIQDNISFIGFQKNPFSWLKRSDLFILSSDWEGFGNVIIEAMACGIPVISTDCSSGPSEIIQSGNNGLLVPTGSINDLSGAIVRLLTDMNLRKKIASQALLDLKRFDHRHIVGEYQKVLMSFTTVPL